MVEAGNGTALQERSHAEQCHTGRQFYCFNLSREEDRGRHGNGVGIYS